MQKRFTQRLRPAILVLALCCLPLTEASAQDAADSSIWKPFEIGFDAVIIRPLRFSTLLIGGAMLGPALALSFPNGETTRDEAIELFWTIPYENLVERELGEF